MSFRTAMQDAMNGSMASNPATQGLGPAPKMPGLPPAPSGAGPVPTGDQGTTRKAAADDSIMSLRNLQGWLPNIGNEINALIDKIKEAVAPQPGAKPGPAVDQPGAPGAASVDASPIMDSGGPLA